MFNEDYIEVPANEIKKICYMEFGHNETGYRTITYKLTDGTFYYDDIMVDTSDINKWDYNANNENNINMGEHTDIFAYYPGIEELSLSENNIQDLLFTSELPRLRVLDIKDNYVVNVTPLWNLENFDAVLCYENPVNFDDGEGGMIIDEN